MSAKDKESREASVLEAIGEQGSNTTTHIDHIWLHPRTGIRVKAADALRFREQLSVCIKECDERWSSERYWQGPQGGGRLTSEELKPYSVLVKYLDAIKFWPKREGRRWPEGIDWILFPARVDVFDRNTMLNPLKELLADKTSRYTASRTGFDDLSLLLFWNLAAIYNSPAETPLHSYDESVEEARRAIHGRTGPFSRVFLYIAIVPGRVFRLH